MPKRRKKLVSKTTFPLFILIIVLATLSVVLSVLLSVADSSSTIPAINVSLGPLEYQIINNQPVLRSDPAVDSLRAILMSTAKKDIQLGCTSSYYRVIAATSDEHQVLLNYGCSYPNANIFAVDSDGNWRLLSPTNEFNEFGIPLCDYVNQNGISPQVAPVCVNQIFQTTATSYQVR